MSSTADDTPIRTDPGLCRDCQHARQMESDRGSIFMLCKLSFQDSRFASIRACRYWFARAIFRVSRFASRADRPYN